MDDPRTVTQSRQVLALHRDHLKSVTRAAELRLQETHEHMEQARALLAQSRLLLASARTARDEQDPPQPDR